MASAAQQRLNRTRISEQLALDLGMPAGFDLLESHTPAGGQAQFALIAQDVARAQPQQPDPWVTSPYAWLKRMPPARRSAAGQVLLARWLAHCGIPFRPRHGDGEHDLLIGPEPSPMRAQLRLSTQWSEGDFVFQGIKSGAYDALLLLGIAPHHVSLWVVPQALALANLNSTGWLHVPADCSPAWLRPHGGPLVTATRLLLPA